MAKLNNRAVIKNCRLSYFNLLKAISFQNGTEEKFRTDIIISKDNKADLEVIKQALADAIESGKTDCFKGKDVSALKKAGKWHSALKDGDVEKPEDEAYKNSYFLSAWSKLEHPPVVYDKYGNKLTADTPNVDSIAYSGVYGSASVTFFPYSTGQNAGTGTIVNGVVCRGEGEKLGGSDIKKEFEEFFESPSKVLEKDNAEDIEDDELI